MNKGNALSINQTVYYRLIALWAICEGFLGGIIHGFKLPISGLIVGSSAVICICLIAFYVPVRGAILKATLIVAIFKMMLSPHSPLPAYFAVFFQGLMGEILFLNRKYYKGAAVVFAVIALMESALQRILVVTIIYGNNLWKAVDDFINGFTKQSVNYSYWLIGFYLFFHFLAGIIAGWFAAVLPGKLRAWNSDAVNFKIQNYDLTVKTSSNKSKSGRIILIAIWTALLLLFIQSGFSIGAPLLPSHVSVQILIRSVLIILTWYFFIGPLLTKFLKTWLVKKRLNSQPEIEKIAALLPSTKFIVNESWKLSSAKKGWKRLPQFCKLVLTNTINNG